MAPLLLLLPLLLSLYPCSVSGTNNTTQPPALCASADRWELKYGRQLVRDYRHRTLLLVFMPPIPAGCDSGDCDELLELEMYEAIVGRMGREIRVQVIANRDEDSGRLKRVTKRFRKLRFEHDTPATPVWEWFSAANWEQLVYDKCSRLAFRLVLNGSLSANHFHFHETLRALRLASEESPCGPCRTVQRTAEIGNGTGTLGPAPTPEFFPKVCRVLTGWLNGNGVWISEDSHQFALISRYTASGRAE